MEFNTWYENADISVKRNGVWYDEETGIAFISDTDALEKAEQRAATEMAADARKAAKMLGGKALQGGSGKQKKWAEELRAGVIAKLTSETAEKVLKQFQFRDTKWWIDNRASFSITRKAIWPNTGNVTTFSPTEQMESAFQKHFDRPRIVAFQKPLRDVLQTFERRVSSLAAHPFERRIVLPSDSVLIDECKKVLATDCTEMKVFDGLMTRLVARAEALGI
ncbi:hypothetical protein MUO32_25955 [Shinella sp. CPCC 101442]|uniref:hypothetical protein n=1 Tax=Shinella sp. CPCC 101442 TaxID=2932265 RepID=UPI0021523B11|nr:hypothetical protein [Shinella sp. CPCC 101442]MCR6502476.1 hypothetical protein [Shinella sp. CPCC 101442]